MDTTKEYIEMCRLAEEIQAAWKFKEYDFFTTMEQVHAKIGFAIADRDFIRKYPTQKNRPTGWIWIPRQDQLQNMIDKESQYKIMMWDDREVGILMPGMTEYNMKNDVTFYRWFNSDKFSWEKLWLMIIMHELHSKRWTGSGWVAE